ncbi:hypothetical protein R69776_08147 [Paraburkholderia nemoris]|uniref:Transposase IS66 central domain-containing protein n=1 Tax=Paraburkholderia nemoris TaxID=2793076 RepID=A0ABM8T765_9BURK|nr:hypothetical protein R69776_08147 [Paraburkholderia nemoris]
MTDSGHPVRCFTYTPGRGAQLADKLFMGIRKGAVLMTDGYEPYNGIAERYQLVHLGCWVHCRRYFVKAEENVPKAARSRDLLATRFIKLIGKLFAAEARTAKWEANQRQRLRRRYSARVLDAIYDLMLEQSPGVVPNSLLGKALTYLREQWPKLILYVENGDWPISNNACHAASGMTGIVVDGSMAILDVAPQVLPLIARVADGVAGQAFGQHLCRLLIEPDFERLQQWQAVRLA